MLRRWIVFWKYNIVINEYYWGEWNLKFQKHGYGLKIISNEIIYFGSFINDELEGFGILIYNIKDFEKNDINNYNSIENNSSISYDFNYNNNFSSQRSKFNFENIDSNNNDKFASEDLASNTIRIISKMKFTAYIGEFKNGLSEGKGELFLPNGEYYKGEFSNNKCHGKGEYHFLNKKIFKGNFLNNKIQNNKGIYFEDSNNDDDNINKNINNNNKENFYFKFRNFNSKLLRKFYK